MAEYESQRIGRSSISDILELLKGFSAGHQRKKTAFDDLYTEYGSGLSDIYDNTQLATRKNQFDKYFQNNREGMDEDTLAKYELLDQKFKNQEELNNDYKHGLARTTAIGEEVETALIDYSNINLDTSLSEKEKNDLRIEKMGKVKQLTQDYTVFSGDFRAKHGQRLGTAGFRQDAAYISNLNEMFTFGIVQAEDDFLLDKAEASAFSLGIQTGSYEPIRAYNANEMARNNDLNNLQQNQMTDLYETYDLNSDYIEKATNFLTLSEISNNTQGLYSIDQVDKAKKEMAKLSEQVIHPSDDSSISDYIYEGLLDPDSDESQLFNSAVESNNEAHSKLENINNIYTKRTGNSYLQDINTSDNENVRSAIDFIINPQKPIDKKEDERVPVKPDIKGDDIVVGTIDISDETKDLVKNKGTAIKYGERHNRHLEEKSTLNLELEVLENEKKSDYDAIDIIKKEVDELVGIHGFLKPGGISPFYKELVGGLRSTLTKEEILDIYGSAEEYSKIAEKILVQWQEYTKQKQILDRRKWGGIHGKKGDEIRFTKKKISKLEKEIEKSKSKFLAIKKNQ